MKKIYILNDTKKSNKKYRSNLMLRLKNLDYYVDSVGLQLRFAYKLIVIYFQNHTLVSSNLKCNLIALTRTSGNTVIILNGLGRYKKIKLFRYLLCFLINRTKAKLYVQNYQDFRYLKIYTKVQKISWVPGSGSINKQKSITSGYFTITRKNKITLQKNQMIDFINLFDADIKVVGVTSDISFLHKRLFPVGIVNQADILKYGSTFVWFGGYGEGFPHSLSDALFNGCTVIINRKEFITFGLNKLDIRIMNTKKSWIECKMKYSNILSEHNVNTKYLETL
jgi:hypothetical protein